MRSWYLRKEWIDRDDDIKDVHILYSCAPVGEPLDWDSHYHRLPLSDGIGSAGAVVSGPGRVRERILDLPCLLWDGRNEQWVAQYLLYYRYEVCQRGRHWTSEVFCDEIVYRELEYVDWEGRLSGVGICWSVVDWGAPMWMPTEDARFSEAFGGEHERCSPRFYRFSDKPRFAMEKWNLMKQLPLPWRWSARIYAPKGSAVRQRWHIGNLSPGMDWEGWDPNPPGDFVHFL